jgi:hypothetical protein
MKAEQVVRVLNMKFGGRPNAEQLEKKQELFWSIYSSEIAFKLRNRYGFGTAIKSVDILKLMREMEDWVVAVRQKGGFWWLDVAEHSRVFNKMFSPKPLRWYAKIWKFGVGLGGTFLDLPKKFLRRKNANVASKTPIR